MALPDDIPLHCWQPGLLSSHFTLRVLQLEHPRLDFVCALRLRRALGTASEVSVESVMTDRDRGWLGCEIENSETLWCSRMSEGTFLRYGDVRDGTMMLLDTKGG